MRFVDLSEHARNKRKSVGIIGGGLSGCLLAIELKKRGYHNVTIFEAKKELFLGASEIISELHSGGEYPFDLQSGKDCLHGLIEFKKRFPRELFAKPNTQFLISKNSSQMGLTLELFTSFCKELQEEYEKILSLKPHIAELLGPAKEFWKALNSSDYQDVINVAAGFTTPQHGIQTKILFDYIKKQIDISRIMVKTLHKVVMVDAVGEGYSFKVNTINGEEEHRFSQIAFADHHSGLSLARSVGSSDFVLPEIYAGLRMIVLARHQKDYHFPRPTRFMLEGIHGAMDGPISKNQSLIYQPGYSQIDKIKFDNSFKIPQDWIRRISLPNSEDQERAKQILERASQIAYPYLASSTVQECYIKIAINTEEDSRKRRNPGVLVPNKNCVSLALTTKATCAALNTGIAAEILSNQD